MANELESKPIAFQDGMIQQENLPYPIVLYPGFYGAFFGFQEKGSSQITLCSCSKMATENYIKMRVIGPIQRNIDPRRAYILDRMYFPVSLVEELMRNRVSPNEQVIANLHFKEGLCHECNKQTPKLRYCHKMYGGSFKQTYGWYINKQAFEWGLDPIQPLHHLENVCPSEVKALFDSELRARDMHEISTSRELMKALQKQNRIILNAVENKVREKFGVEKIRERART